MGNRTQLIVELDAASDPVQGTIGPSHGSGKPFSGYVQLIAALEGFRVDPGAAGGEETSDGYRGERAAGAAS
jgi:hypothetical protein